VSSFSTDCTTHAMAETRDPDIYAAPSPLPPTEAELEEWNALTRDEQIARYREYFAGPDCDAFTNETPDEILAAARAQVAARRRV
jgi:hypothetical protein